MPIRIGQLPDRRFDEPLGLLSDCHRHIEHFLKVLVDTERHAAGKPLTAAQRVDLDSALTYFAAAAPKHTADEEESLFPRLRAAADPVAIQTLEQVVRLERDHEEANRHHRAVDTLVRRWLADGLEANDAGQLRSHLAALVALYQPHITLEDRDLFPAAAKLPFADQHADIGREMAARRKAPLRR